MQEVYQKLELRRNINLFENMLLKVILMIRCYAVRLSLTMKNSRQHVGQSVVRAGCKQRYVSYSKISYRMHALNFKQIPLTRVS